MTREIRLDWDLAALSGSARNREVGDPKMRKSPKNKQVSTDMRGRNTPVCSEIC